MIGNDINNAPLLWPWLAVAVAVAEVWEYWDRTVVASNLIILIVVVW